VNNIIDYTAGELENFVTENGFEKFRAKQIFRGLHKSLALKFDEIRGIPKNLISTLEQNFFIERLKTVSVQQSKQYNTQKFLFEIQGKLKKEKSVRIESVYMEENGRITLCISSQAGCNAGCVFCATGQLGLIQNLSLSGIVSQVYEIIRVTGKKPTNIVYMGMGEPLLNYDNVLRSLKVLTSEDGLEIPSRRITLSTVGLLGKIKRFADDISSEENKSTRNTKLALSLHSTDNGIREKLIPISARNKLSGIYDEITYFYRTTGNKVTYEYIFFKGINDSDNDVKRISALSKMIPSNVNIVPFHPISGLENGDDNIGGDNIKDKIFYSLKNSLYSDYEITHFAERLREKGVVTNIRTSNGIDIDAACGQLAAKNVKPKENNMIHQLLIFGPPGVGKGTQAEKIAADMNLFHLSTGEYLRKAVSEGTELGLKAKEIMNAGHLVPDDIMIGIVKEALEENVTESGFILDGFPRTIEQAKALSEIFKAMGFDSIKIITLSANEDEIVRRLLKRGRTDDTEEIIRKRMKVYCETTYPIIDYYKGNARVIEINGVGEIEDINIEIISKL
jgi:23S rRNA (adenine2503-C2)-methyltransferase